MVFAQEAPLGEMDLPPAPIVVDLSDAVVRIVSTDTTDALVRWWPARPGASGSAEVAAYQEGAAIVIARPDLREGETAARVRVEIVVGTGQGISIYGDGIDLEMGRDQAEELEQLSADDAPRPAPALPVQLQLSESEIGLSGYGGVVGTLDGCTSEFRQTTGNHELTARDSQVRLVGHRGSIVVSSEGADVIAEDADGSFAVKGSGGSVDLRSTRGRIKIELSDASLQILDSRGPGLIALTESNADLRDTQFQNMNIKSVMSHVTTSSCGGDHTIDFSGGSLSEDSGSGTVTGTARGGARIELSDHHGNVKVNLLEDTSADLRMIDGDVNLSSREGEVTVEGAKSLTIVLNNTWATLSGIEKLASFQATGSEVDLDLTTSHARKLQVAAQAGSSVRVHLATPCRVHATGLSGSLARQVDVTGCELQLGKAGRWATKRVRGIDGQPPILLTAKVADNAELSVEGRP